MQTMTSAYANKMLKSLEEDKAFWVNKEATSSTYVAAINEEPVVPEYDYTEVVATITSLDEKIAIIKHALNVTNSNEKVQVGDAEMSIDTILIKMAQLNKRKSVLDQMRKQLPKAREEQRSYMSRNTVPEYRYINYDLELIKKEYEAVSKTIMEMQMALDKYNQTVQFDKRSKKAQREYYAKQRTTWGELNPVTRSVPSGKAYNRKKEKQRIGVEFRNGFDADFLRSLVLFIHFRTSESE